MAGYELSIDGSGAEAGSQRIVKSFDAIKAAADRMEGGVSAAAKKASSSFADLQRNARPVSDAAIKTLKALSDVFKNFRGPTDAAVRNTIIFLQGLKSVGSLNLGRVSGLQSLLSAISGYRGPSATAGRNTVSVLNALSKASGFSSARGLAPMLAALSAFRGPSAAAARNVTSLLTALNNFKSGPGLSATIRALEKLTSAANSARTSLNSLKGAGPTTVNIKSNTRQAEAGFLSLIKSQGLLQTALLRTQTAWNALGGILAGRAIIGASNDLIKIHAQLQAATGSATKAGFAFGFLREFSEKMGLEFVTAAKSFGFFLGSVKGTNLTLDESRQIFQGFSTAARALQLSTSDVDGVFRALGQMMSKGKIQAEELRGQLGDRLPGAFVRFAVALKMTKPGELDQALKKGAISGERMKNAIIDVANALQVEFAGSADKMSKTVDSAFNRLKNAFTFAAGDLGQSGLNQALISILDTATKLLKSDTFNTFMTGLGAVFKFLGDHIEVVATIMGTLALSSTLKWAASLVGLSVAATSATAATTVAAAATGAQAAAAVTATAATTAWGAAWTRLNIIMRANFFLLLASTIVAVMMALKSTTTAMEDNAKALDAVNARMPDAANFSDAYAARLLNLADSANQVTASLQEMIRQMNEAAIRASQEDLKGLDTYKRIGAVGGYGINVRSQEGKLVKGPEGFFTKQDQDLLNRVVYRSPTGGVALRGTGEPQSKQEFEQLGAAMAMVDTRASGAGGGNFAPIQNALHARFNALISQSRQKGYTGQPYSDWAEQIVPGYNKPVGGIDGGSPASTKKKSHKKTDAERAADDIADAIDQAQKGMTDLQVRARSTTDIVGGLLSGSFDKYTAAAHRAAMDQEKTFEDSIKGHGKVSEQASQQSAVLQLAGSLQASGKIAAGTDISSYEKAKSAVIDYMEALQALDAQRKRDDEVANNVAVMREQNDVQQDAIALLKVHGTTQATYDRQVEIENALLGTSLEMRPQLRAELEKELDRREALKHSLQLTNAERDHENQLALDKALTPMYQSGMKSEDIDYYRDMLQYRQQLIDQNWSGNDLRDMVSLHAATLNEARAMKVLEDRYEDARQTAADMADAIVGGFRDGMQAGDNFLDTFKNIFKQLSKIIMDFVLYNPLKQWLQQALTQTIAPQSTSGYGAMSSLGGGTTSSYSTGGNWIQSLLNNFTQSSLSTGVGPNHAWNYDSSRFLAPRANGTSIDPATGAVSIIGSRTGQTSDLNAPIPGASASKQLNFYQNFMNTMKTSQAGFKSFTNFLKTGKGAGAGISGALSSGMTAFAMYQTGNQIGKSVAKAIGGGFRTQAVMGGITGGAAAGFSLGGPVGAAIGAVVGGVLGFLKKKPKLPSSYGSVTVGDQGFATSGGVGHYGKTTDEAGKAMSNAAATMFNNFALQYGAKLAPGAYGTFGSRVFDKKTGAQSFYSTLGTDRKGRPIGREGTDWIKGTDSQIQAFSILQQFKKGMIQGLSQTMRTVLTNTKASDMESLQADLDVGKAYDEFVKGSFKLTDVASKVRDLNETFYKLKQQAGALGLSETKLAKARQRMMDTMKDEFNYSIKQGILGYTNPSQAAYNDLVKEFHDAVEEAMAVGGDLTAVEDYYGRKRVDLAKQWADIATNGLVSAAKDLYDSLTASSSSPLNATTILGNSRDLYSGLTNQFASGDFSNVDKLSTYAQNYLDAARSLYGSSTDYFDIFKQVTDQLNQYESPGSGGLTGVGTAPDLPSLDDMVQEINSSSLDMIDAMGTVGQAVVEGSTNIVDAINNLAISLGYQIPSTSPIPTGPTAGGTGVTSTGGTYTGGVDYYRYGSRLNLA